MSEREAVSDVDALLALGEELDSHRLEIHRLAAEVRRLEAELRAERHEHAETRARLAKATSVSAYDLNPSAAQLCRLEHA